ncbi:MAG: glutamate-1-semialdehyde 2,1-aminomutase [Akkermansiaceae bacterium]|nr:glutamate-1-semialdehyde 2,1-aminomutase [Armatimonadota bacterium]
MTNDLNRTRSAELFTRANQVIPGGVNSPVRAFRSVGGDPLFIERGEGAYLVDVDSNRYLDLVGSWGPLIFGHADPVILSAVNEVMARGTTFGASTEAEVLFAEEIRDAVPSVEKVRLVSSGTEAAMSFLRVARGYTGKNKIVKFEGCYHGHSDGLLAKAGSGLATFGLPDSAGVPAGVTAGTLTLPFNDLDAVATLLESDSDIAAVALEVVAGNMGCVAPASGFLQGLRALTREHGVLLLFDEVMTGFRLAYGGAQERFGVTPDLCALGKIVGGGLPLAAYGGRAEIMDCVAPVGPVYQAGTLSGNPLAVAAGRAMLRKLREQPPYDYLETQVTTLCERLRESAKHTDVPVTVNQVGSMFTVFFTDQPVTDYTSAKTSDTDRFGRFFREMLNRGVYLPPSQFEAAFASAAITPEGYDHIANVADAAFATL